MMMVHIIHIFAHLFLFDLGTIHAALLAGTLLHGVLFLLAVATTHAFRGRALGPKGRPRTKVLASLAPLDFESLQFQGHPVGDIASRAHALVLTRDNVGRTPGSTAGSTSGVFALLFGIGLFVGADKGCRHAKLSTHDAALLAAWRGTTVAVSSSAALDQKVGKVDEAMKVGKNDVLVGIRVTVSKMIRSTRREKTV